MLFTNKSHVFAAFHTMTFYYHVYDVTFVIVHAVGHDRQC